MASRALGLTFPDLVFNSSPLFQATGQCRCTDSTYLIDCFLCMAELSAIRSNPQQSVDLFRSDTLWSIHKNRVPGTRFQSLNTL